MVLSVCTVLGIVAHVHKNLPRAFQLFNPLSFAIFFVSFKELQRNPTTETILEQSQLAPCNG